MKVERLASYINIKKRLGLFTLLILLFFLSLATIKPQFYLIGWDNFSSYFNLKANLFRTFFSAWREYRGLGVPSDSEAVDLFRQIFFLILSPFVKTGLLEQIYFLFCLNIGVLGMYFFTKAFFRHVFSASKDQNLEIAALIASFFYLFNLNTLATFYFPMAMYINRFAALPILFLIFLTFIKKKSVNLKTWILAVLAIFFTTTSYLTATIFIVFLLFVFIFGLSLGGKKRTAIVALLFLGLNLFWLFPFANYALEKADIIKLAPSFIDANESQLNKPASFYSLEKVSVLYPNFLDTEITDIAEGNSHYLYPQTDFFRNIIGRIILLIFPLFYLGGVTLILVKYRKRVFLWLPSVIFLSLFLVGKEFTPLGFVYNLVEKIIPYFKVLFRFADTKFNIYIALCGSLSAGLVSFHLFTFLHGRKRRHRYFVMAGLFLVLIPYFFVFSSYFKGNLIAPFMYNKMPPAYFEIAKMINEDREDFRVLHLPMNEAGYWKFYVWGMAGSSFLNFMLDKPLIDRAFEPASMENAYLHQAIFQNVDNAQDIEEQQKLNEKSEKFYRLLSDISVKYIIWDETVSTAVYSRGVKFWGEFDAYDAKRILENLANLGLLETKADFRLNILDYLNLYSQRYPLDQTTTDRLVKNPFYSIKLFEVKDTQAKFYFVQQATPIDPNLDNLLATNLVFQGQNYLQGKDKRAISLFPFQRQETPLRKDENKLTFDLKNIFPDSGRFRIELNGKDIKGMSHDVEIFAKSDNGSLTISFYRLPIPLIQNQKTTEYLGQMEIPLAKVENSLKARNNLDNYFSDWSILNFREISDLRLSVNGYILPLPAELESKDTLVTTVVVSGDEISAELLTKEKSSNINLADFQLTENPNCFGDKIEDYNFEFKQNDGRLTLLSKNGSTCLVKSIENDLSKETSHLEMKFNLEAKAEDGDYFYPQTLGETTRPLLKEYVLSQPKPNLFRICLRGQHTEECFNKHQILNLEDKQTVTVPLESPVKYLYGPLVLLASSNIGYQEQEVILNSLVFDQFKPVGEVKLEIKPPAESYEINLDSSQEINLQIPKALSRQSFYFDEEKDGFYLSNQPCREKPESYRTFRLIGNRWVSFFENCSNIISVKSNFDSRRFYLWNIDYHLFSGKYPKYLLEDGFRSYKNSYLSLGQGYPDVPSFKDLQKPEGFITWLTKPIYQRELEKKFSDVVPQTAYTYVYPQPELSDEESKDYTLHQDSENEGILGLFAFNIIELPNTWQNLAIRKTGNSGDYVLPQGVEYKQILPSLWRIDFQSIQGEKPALLVFNEAYDQQWQLHKNILGLLLGTQNEGLLHLKFNGYANAWEINNSEGQSFYVFYAPEKLSWLGWVLTLVTIAAGFIVLRFWSLRKTLKTDQLN